MTIVPRRYQKRPIQIQALQFTDNVSADAIAKWGGSPPISLGIDPADGTCYGIEIETPEGTMIASLGNWVIQGIQGEFYPCRADIFEATYEPVYDPEADPNQLALFPRPSVG